MRPREKGCEEQRKQRKREKSSEYFLRSGRCHGGSLRSSRKRPFPCSPVTVDRSSCSSSSAENARTRTRFYSARERDTCHARARPRERVLDEEKCRRRKCRSVDQRKMSPGRAHSLFSFRDSVCLLRTRRVRESSIRSGVIGFPW